MNLVVLIFLVIYFVLIVGIGYWANLMGEAKKTGAYLLGGREVSPMVTSMTLQSTSMSGFMFLGAGSEGFRTGYWALWYAAGDIGGGVVNLSILGRRMRKLSKIMGALTSIEYLEKRYPHPATRFISGVLTVGFLFFYILAQFIAGGKGLALLTGLPYWAALLIAVGIILTYAFMAGYFAVAYTDFFQSMVMVVAVVWIFGAALVYVGGWTSANEAVGQIDPTLLSIWGRGLQYDHAWGQVAGALLIFSVGYMGWPHVVMRHMVMSSPKTARTAGLYSTLWNLFFVMAPYLIGILAIIIVPNLDDPELAIFQVALRLLPGSVAGIVMASIMGGIMSTSNSILLQVGTIASRDLYQRFFNRTAGETGLVWVSRLMVLLIGVLGYFIALFHPPGVFSIVVFTTSVLGSAFLPAYVCAVWWKKANTPGAISSILGGACTAIIWKATAISSLINLHPMLIGLLVSSALMVIVSLVTQKACPVPSQIVTAMAEAEKIGPVPRKVLKGTDPDLFGEAHAVSGVLRKGRHR